MVTIDGSEQSGSGTIVRYAVALAGLTGESVHVVNARARRATPGLRPQHVASILACAALCGGETDGVAVGSREFVFRPGPRIAGGRFRWNIGTAGSATMLGLGVMPMAAVAEQTVNLDIDGGVFQDFAPSPHHLQHVLAPTLAEMGLTIDIQIARAGYVPAGAGMVRLSVTPSRSPLRPMVATEPGRFRRVNGIAFSSHLAARRVSERMARACQERLERAGLSCEIAQVDDATALQPGACLTIWASSSTGCILGADRAGAPRRTSEAIGRHVSDAFLSDIKSGATVDRHLADQVVLFAALADGTSRYVIPVETDHLRTNLWLVSRFGASCTCIDRVVTIDGLGLPRSSRA